MTTGIFAWTSTRSSAWARRSARSTSVGLSPRANMNPLSLLGLCPVHPQQMEAEPQLQAAE